MPIVIPLFELSRAVVIKAYIGFGFSPTQFHSSVIVFL